MDETDRAIEIAKRKVESETLRVLTRVAMVANQTLVYATPVDTGRARGNWFVGLDSPVTQKQENNFDPTGASTVGQNNSIINSNKKAFRTIYISNNLGYIEALNKGHSKQAPPGYVEKMVQAARQVGNEL